jgi:hypothetical protein
MAVSGSSSGRRGPQRRTALNAKSMSAGSSGQCLDNNLRAVGWSEKSINEKTESNATNASRSVKLTRPLEKRPDIPTNRSVGPCEAKARSCNSDRLGVSGHPIVSAPRTAPVTERSSVDPMVVRRRRSTSTRPANMRPSVRAALRWLSRSSS